MKSGALLLLLLATAALAEDPPPAPRIPSDATHSFAARRWGWQEQKPESRRLALEALPPGAAAAARRLLDRTFTVHAMVYCFEEPPAVVADLLRARTPLVSRKDLDRIRSSARTGQLEVAHAAGATGRAGEVLSSRTVARHSGLLRYDLESAIEVVASYPKVDTVQEGFWLVAKLRLFPGRGVTLRYRLVLTDSAESEIRSSLAGEIEYSSVPALLLEGGVRLAPGETVAAFARRDAGRGTMVLLRLEGSREALPPLAELGDGWVMVPAEHLTDAPSLPAPWADGYDPTVYRAGRMEPLQEDYKDAGWDRALEGADAPGYEWDSGPLGVFFARPEEPFRRRLATVLAAEADHRAASCALDLRRPGWGTVRLPLSPGEGFQLFLGRVETVWSGTEVQAGCNETTGAIPRTRWDQTGLAATGRLRGSGIVDLDLRGREVLETRWQSFLARRIEAGYRSFARDLFEAPRVTERVLLYRGALPPGDAPLVGGVRATLRGRALDGGTWMLVNGASAALAPGGEAIVADYVRRDFVRSWDTEGWCGMTVRFPVLRGPFSRPSFGSHAPHLVWEGSWVRLTNSGLAAVGGKNDCLDVEFDVRGPPEVLGVLDPLDGEVEIVRQPRIRGESRVFDLDGGGSVAWGEGLTVTVLRPDGIAAKPLGRRVVVRRPQGEAGLRFGSEGWLDAGGVTLLPGSFRIYSSNHEMGEVTTEFLHVADGLRIDAEESEDETVLVSMEILSRPEWEPHLVRIVNSPDRPEDHLRTLRVSRRRTRRAFLFQTGGSLEYETPAGSAEVYRISAGGAR